MKQVNTLILILFFFGSKCQTSGFSFDQTAEMLGGIWSLDTLRKDSLLQVQTRTQYGVEKLTFIKGELYRTEQKTGQFVIELKFNKYGIGTYDQFENYGDTSVTTITDDLPVPELVEKNNQYFIMWTMFNGEELEEILFISKDKLILQNEEGCQRIFKRIK